MYLFFGTVLYWPQLASNHFAPKAVLAAFYLLVVISVAASAYFVALSHRFPLARLCSAISLVCNLGLVAILAFIYGLLNFSGIEFPGPG